MARLPRLAVPGHPHLVALRGHNRQVVFQNDTDYQVFLDTLRNYAVTAGLAVHAYVLLPAEVRLLATPADAGALSRTMQSLGRRYVAWYNRQHGRSGALWEARFRAGVVEADPYVLRCTVLLESLPLRHGLVLPGQDWPWSSLGHHLGHRRDPLVSEHGCWWALGNTPFDREVAYRRLFEQGLGEREVQHIEQTALQGWALGSPAFLAALAPVAARPLQPRPRGRPRKHNPVPI